VYTTFKLTSCDPLAAFFCAPHSPLLLLPGPGENWGRGSGPFHQRDRRIEWRYCRVGGLALYSDENFRRYITAVVSKQELKAKTKISFLVFIVYSPIFNDVFKAFNLYFYMPQKFILLSDGIRLLSITFRVLAWLAISDFQAQMLYTSSYN
jgi:hypothetical protein